MKTFSVKLAAFALLQLLIFAVLLWHYDVSTEANYLAATADKHRRLAQTAPPRLLILGGSNVPFGIQSDRLEQALGRPVVNMGLVAGAGLDFMLSEIKPSLRRGDLVLLSLEYDQFGGGFDPNILRQLIIFRPANALFLQPKHFKKLVLDRGLVMVGEIVRRGAAATLASLAGRASATPLSLPRRGFNEWGDLRAHYGQPPRITVENLQNARLVPPRQTWPSPAVRVTLERFARDCHRRGILFAFTFPPQPPQSLRHYREVVSQIATALRAIPYLVVLDSPQVQSYDPTLFFDTGYHLTEPGATQRTDRLIAALKAVLENPGLARPMVPQDGR
jgi:hypothetical protein